MRPVTLFITLWFAAVIITLAATNHAYPHSWYDPWCCNNQDCKKLEPHELRVTSEGYHIKEEFFIPHGDERIRMSQDWDYHFCEYPTGQARCFYVPPGGS